MTGLRGKEGTGSTCFSAQTAESNAEEGAVLCTAGADAAVGNRTESTGDPARLIRLPPCFTNELAVIEDKATVSSYFFCHYSSLYLTLPSSVWEAFTTSEDNKGDSRGES